MRSASDFGMSGAATGNGAASAISGDITVTTAAAAATPNKPLTKDLRSIKPSIDTANRPVDKLDLS
jgi:hypothetical protein